MGDIPIEKKLELVHQIRSRYHQNKSDLMNREQILYGRNASEKTEYQMPGMADDMSESINDGSFKIRLALAAVIVLTIILFDKSQKSFAGVSMEQVFETIAIDYEAKLDEWVETLSQSVKK